MKYWKYSLITAIAFFGITSTVLFSSCEQDSCLDLNCKNGGSCADGFCRCQTGYEGTECEILAGIKFVGRFIGNVKCDDLPPLVDTIEIWMSAEPNQLTLVQHSRKFDTIKGIASGQYMNVPVFYNGSSRKSVNVLIDARRLAYFIEEVGDTTTLEGTKHVCNFIGFK